MTKLAGRSLMHKHQQNLQARREQHLYRQRRIIHGPQGIELQSEQGTLLSFCSNDYLGLANHPDTVKALQNAANEYGVGSGASHLISGHSHAHHALEEELAEFTQRPRALLFSTGYMANLGAIDALMEKGDVVIQDKLNHASLLDASRLSLATLQRYVHCDMGSLQQVLQQHQSKAVTDTPCSQLLIATDGVFSMDGDIAPLDQIAALCHSHQATLMVDDAHGFGVLGENGRGSVEHFKLNTQQVPILMATLGKAVGSFGAFIAGEDDLIETLIQQARSYIYTTAMPAAVAEATRCSLNIMRQETWRRDKLQQLIRHFRRGAEQIGLQLMESDTPIQPLVMGGAQQALQLSQQLEQAGFLVTAIRPPTVANNRSRLRITLSALHSKQHIDQLLDALGTLTKTLDKQA